MPIMRGYWFSRPNRKLGYGDGRKARLGITHTVSRSRKLELCVYGLHASPTAFDALAYAPGPILWRVRLNGPCARQVDKAASYSRTYLQRIDATSLLIKFSRLRAANAAGASAATWAAWAAWAAGRAAWDADAAWDAADATRAPWDARAARPAQQKRLFNRLVNQAFKHA